MELKEVPTRIDLDNEKEARWQALALAHDRHRLVMRDERPGIERLLEEAEKIHQYVQNGGQ